MTQPTSRRRRAYDPQGTRQRILDVAARAFQTQGYHATSMHDVMRLADAPGGSVYHHFPTKKQLGLAVIAECVRADVIRTWVEPLESAAIARAGVLAVFDAVARDIEARGAGVVGCPVTNLALELSLVDPDFQHALHEIFTEWGNAVERRLRADLDAGRLDGDPKSLATAIVASFSGAMSLAKATQSVEPIRLCAGQIERLMPVA